MTRIIVHGTNLMPFVDLVGNGRLGIPDGSESGRVYCSQRACRACFPSVCHWEMSHLVRLPASLASIESFISEATIDANSGLIGTATWLSSTNAASIGSRGSDFLRQVVTWVEEEDIHDDLLRLLGCFAIASSLPSCLAEIAVSTEMAVFPPRRWMPRLIFLTRHSGPISLRDDQATVLFL